MKKGFIKTLEGALSMFILLAFIFYVIPHIPRESGISDSTRNFVTLSLENMDMAGTLDNYLFENSTNLTAITDALNTSVPPNLNYTVAVTKINATEGTVYSEESYKGVNISYWSNISAMRSARLSLDLRGATNPRAYANSIPVFIYSGNYTGSTVRLDITKNTINGTNNILIETINNATVGYVVLVENEEIHSQIPSDRPVGIATYIKAGRTGYFQPATVEVYLWEQ